MAAELLQAAPAALSAALQPRHWRRLRFRKSDQLRLVSHIDLLHVFERLFRRAEVPVAWTKGFHPKPNVVFAHALALGIAGLDEVVDLELTQPLEAGELCDRLNRQAPPGLTFLACRALAKKGSAAVRRAFYRLALPAPAPDLPRRCADLLASARCVVLRGKPQPRRLDIKPYFHDIAADAAELRFTLWITPYGAARPEEVVRALGLGHLLDDGAVLERTRLEMMDELPEHERWLPDIPRLAEAPGDDALPALAEPPSRPAPAQESLLPNPLSFET